MQTCSTITVQCTRTFTAGLQEIPPPCILYNNPKTKGNATQCLLRHLIPNYKNWQKAESLRCQPYELGVHIVQYIGNITPCSSLLPLSCCVSCEVQCVGGSCPAFEQHQCLGWPVLPPLHRPLDPSSTGKHSAVPV